VIVSRSPIPAAHANEGTAAPYGDIDAERMDLLALFMRTTMIIPPELVEEAREAAGLKTKTETVIYALQELIRHKRLGELKSMFGTTEVDVDLAYVRGRARQARA
jgi:Arc/MetJ family transcription regulator